MAGFRNAPWLESPGGTTLATRGHRHHGIALCLYLLGVLLSRAALGDAGCRGNEGCQFGRKCLVNSHATHGQCSAFLPPEGLADQTRRALPLPLRERQVGDTCEFSVDCLPGHGCFFEAEFSLLGICLPACRIGRIDG